MNPATSGNPAMDAALTAATIFTGPQPGPSWGSVRRSRLPVSWSSIPTTMKSAALPSPWATSSTHPASTAAGVPSPNSSARYPS
jgi:hypothetical protein